MKRCTKCDKIKLSFGFSKDRTRKDGLSVWCKTCVNKSHAARKDELSIYGRKWDAANRDRRRGYGRRTYARHPEKIKEDSRRYRAAHPESDLAHGRNRRALKKGSGGTITAQEFEDLKKFYDYTCLCCRRQEPEIKLTLDHVLPLVMGGKHAISNAQPLCLSCNSSKNAKHIDYRQVVFSERS